MRPKLKGRGDFNLPHLTLRATECAQSGRSRVPLYGKVGGMSVGVLNDEMRTKR